MIFEQDSDTATKLKAIRAHMDEAKVRQEVRWMVEHMFKSVWAEQDRLLVSKELVSEAIEVFSTLSKGHRLMPEAPDEVWIPARNGILTVGDSVRVRGDAYSAHPATDHNGRTGRITAIRYGDIHVYYDAKPEETIHSSVRHKADMLEKRVR